MFCFPIRPWWPTARPWSAVKKIHVLSAMPEVSSASRMRPGDTDRARPRAHVVGMGESGAALRETIEMGSFDVGPVRSGDGIEGLVVGEKEEDVRFGRCGGDMA